MSYFRRLSLSVWGCAFLANGVASTPFFGQAQDPAITTKPEKDSDRKDSKAPDTTSQPAGKPTTSLNAAGINASSDYRVGVDDELMVSVWHEPELSQAVTVRPDGMITLPLLDDIKVVGMTTQELQAALTERLKSIVNEPQVTIVVKAIKSQRVFLTGAVAKQGVYPLSGTTTVLQLIAQGGGLGPFAKVRAIYVLRHENGKEIRIPVNYKKALAGKSDDVVLRSGDMVVVP